MIRMDLLDRLGNVQEAWIGDPDRPVITSLAGHALLDLASHPFYPQKLAPFKPDQPVKRILDAFFVVPSPGLDVEWLKENPVFFEQAVYVMLGRVPINVEWQS